MSQFPSPYPSLPYAPPPIDFSGYQAPEDLLRPARRAGTLVIVLGVLIGLFGACNGGQAIVQSPADIAEQQAELRKAGLPTESPFSFEAIRTINVVGGVLLLLLGVGLIVNGVYVRRGSSGAAVVGLVLTGGLGLLAGATVLLFVIGAFMAPLLGVMACMFVVPFALLIWAFVWLVSAARHGSRVAAAQQQYQSQYYHYWQQQQAYGQTPGYPMPYPPQGYGSPTPPAPWPQGYGAPTAPPAGPSTPAPTSYPDPNAPRPPEA